MVYSKHIVFKEIEQKIIEQLKYGYTNAEIGDILHISRHTVKYYVSSIMNKLGAVNRINAVFLLAAGGYFKEIE